MVDEGCTVKDRERLGGREQKLDKRSRKERKEFFMSTISFGGGAVACYKRSKT